MGGGYFFVVQVECQYIDGIEFVEVLFGFLLDVVIQVLLFVENEEVFFVGFCCYQSVGVVFFVIGCIKFDVFVGIGWGGFVGYFVFVFEVVIVCKLFYVGGVSVVGCVVVILVSCEKQV